MFVGVRQILAGTLTLGGFFTYTMFLGFMAAPLFGVVQIGTQLTEAIAGLERTREVLNEHREDEDPRRTIALPEVLGDIEFRHVGLRYETGKPVLQDVSFESKPVTVTALVGSSGSGKSTIIGLFAAFHVPNAGQVMIDGTDLSTVKLSSYRTNLGMVLQDSFLFDGTIRENIAFSRPDATDEEVLRARGIGRVHGFAERFRGAYHIVLGERGVQLSGRERQRVWVVAGVSA